MDGGYEAAELGYLKGTASELGSGFTSVAEMAFSGLWKPFAPVSLTETTDPCLACGEAGAFSMHRRVWGSDSLTGGERH